jgi:hypothetical protein
VSTGGAGVSVFFPFRFGGGGGDEEEDDWSTSSGTAIFLTYRRLGGAGGASSGDVSTGVSTGGGAAGVSTGGGAAGVSAGFFGLPLRFGSGVGAATTRGSAGSFALLRRGGLDGFDICHSVF